MVLYVILYGCERWTMKKAEYHIIDAFERQKLCAVGEDSSESFGLQGNQTSQSKVNEP